ncbi:T-cell surface glycoprotein CD3 zeta chain isoform X2 [Ascaphus truei]|uniref:T-cell surface glycoprotein CD3 zeta chain isoform X2 n=1 Tax=Ascaphus truei TaxID=8439 RepID=UPI003F5987D8
MKYKWIALSAFLQAEVLVTDAQVLGLTDPRLCYILDGILFLYAVIVTALFFKEKLTAKAPPPPYEKDENLYNALSHAQRDEYDELNKGGDPEKGARRQQRRKPQQDTVYTALQKDKMGEEYSKIGMKGEQQRKRGKGNDTVYQGLSTATRDTYDALQMQPLPPPPPR